MEATTQQLLDKLGSTLAESMGSVFSMLTGREFTVHAKPGERLEITAVQEILTDVTILVKAHYTKSLTGDVFFVLPLKEGAMLVDLMLGGEGAPAPELSSDSRDALSETFNQILGSTNQTLSDMAGETVAIANVEILTLEKGHGSLPREMGPCFDIALPTAQDILTANIRLLLPESLAEVMQRKLGLVPAESAPAPPPAVASPAPPAPAAGPATATRQVPSGTTALSRHAGPSVDTGNLDLLLDIELPVMVRMGQAEMQLGDLLKLTPGAILELNRPADAPVDLLVNGKQIAKGEVVVVDGNFAFRITEIESTDSRIRSLG